MTPQQASRLILAAAHDQNVAKALAWMRSNNDSMHLIMQHLARQTEAGSSLTKAVAMFAIIGYQSVALASEEKP